MRARIRSAGPRPGPHEREGVGRSGGSLPEESVTRPAGAGSALLRLQRDYGNHYVQDVISRAQSPDPGPPPRSSDSRPVIAGVVGASLRRAIEGSRRGGRPLDHRTATELGAALGQDISHVRVHDDDQADRLSRSLDAAAFTIGSDIFFRARHYRPGTTAGRRLLAHELAHVAQQGTGLRSAHRYRLAPAGDPGERAADRAAEDIAVRGRAHPAAVQPQVPLIQRKAFIGPDAPRSRVVAFGDPRDELLASEESAEPGGPDQGLKKKPGRVRRRKRDARRGRPRGDDLPRVRSRPKPVMIPPEDSQRGTDDRNLGQVVTDNRARYFRAIDELYLFAAGKTDDIGYVDREKTWARLPDEFLVLGESHDKTTVMDLVEATGVTNYIYEASDARPSPYLYPGQQIKAREHQLEESLPKFVVGLIGVRRTLATEIRRLDLQDPGWKKEIRDQRLTAERTDPEAEKQKYQADLKQWSSGWETKYQTRDQRGEWKTDPTGNLIGQHKTGGGLWSPAPGKPYDRDKVEVKATLLVLRAIRDMGRGKKDPIARFYAENSEVIDKTVRQLEEGLPVELTRMFLKMATGKFDLLPLIKHLGGAAVQERADLKVTSVQTYQSYKPEKFGDPIHDQAEELRDSHMLHRIIEAKASGYRLAGLGDAHRDRLQQVLEQLIPGIIVQSSSDFYVDQYRLHPDRD